MGNRSEKRFCETLYRLGENVVWIVALSVIWILLTFNMIYNATVAYNVKETVSITTGAFVYGLPALLLGYIFAAVSKIMPRVKEHTIFCFFGVIYLIAGAYWIHNISTTLRADAALINHAMQLAAMGDFSFLELGQDIRNHPWQLGMITYERILGKFSQNVQLLFLINLLEILGINYLTYRMADVIFEHNRRTNILTIIFAFAFLPQFFFLAFAYGLIPGFFCMMCSFYFQQKYFRERKWWHLFFALVMVMLAVTLKSNFTVGAIVMTLLFLMKALQEKRVWYLLLALVFFVAAQIPGPALIAAYESESGYDLNSGEPKLLYIAMGIMPENRGMAPGWYCGYNDFTFSAADFDPEVANEMAKESIGKSLAHYVKDPADAADFFSGKIASVWCEPMYQSLWSGPLEDANQPVNTRTLRSLYQGGALENLVSGYMKSFLLLLLGLTFIYVIHERKRSYAFGYALIYLIGGFLLHIVWEGKSQYVYTYIFILLPGCAQALVLLTERLELFLKKEGDKNGIQRA